VIRRGEIRWATFPAPANAHAPRRPVLIVSGDAFNASRIGTVLGVVLSSRLELAAAPGNLLVTAAESGLPRDAVVVVSQVVTLDRRWLGGAVGRLSDRRLAAADHGLALATGLHRP
jgi:mRNA interferase MazF